MIIKTIAVTFGFAAAALLGGCVVESEGADENVASSREELMTSTSFWSQGDPPVPMGSASNRFCFLTHVTGRFEGGGESVHVRIVNGQWELFGTSGQSGVMGWARCQLGIVGTNVGPEFSWSQGQAQVNLGSTQNRACFLTRVSGKFAGMGEGVWVNKSGSTYFLGGQSQQSGIAARARCLLNTTTFTNDWTFQGSDGGVIMVQALTENNGWACGITRMQGAFKGNGEFIDISWTGNTRNLRVRSQQGGILANANCF